MKTRSLVARYDDVVALRGIDFEVAPGEVVALMGRNGAGKSTLLAHLVGLLAPASGQVEVAGGDPRRFSASELVRQVALVPASASDLLCADTIDDEIGADGAVAAAARALLEELSPGIDTARHPRDLSEGQRLALALAVMLALDPPALLLDEPTRGLDYPAKARLVKVLRERAAGGAAIVVATHDVELAADLATRVVVLASGEVIADGPTREVVTASPAFAPQVAKILSPLTLLTVAQVRAALEASPA